MSIEGNQISNAELRDIQVGQCDPLSPNEVAAIANGLPMVSSATLHIEESVQNGQSVIGKLCEYLEDHMPDKQVQLTTEFGENAGPINDILVADNTLSPLIGGKPV